MQNPQALEIGSTSPPPQYNPQSFVQSNLGEEQKSDLVISSQVDDGADANYDDHASPQNATEYDIVMNFYSIDFSFVIGSFVLGLAIGFIIGVCTGKYEAVWITGVILAFLALLWSESYGTKKEIKIEGEAMENMHDTLKKPQDTEFYLRSDFLDRQQRPRGFSMVYVLKDAPGALNIREHSLRRLLYYNGFEIGAGTVSFIFFIISAIAAAFSSMHIVIVIVVTYLGCLIGAAFEIRLRKRKILFQPNTAYTKIISIPFYSMGIVEATSLGFNEAYPIAFRDRPFERLAIYWYKFLTLIYSIAIYWATFFPRLFSGNAFLTLWSLVTITVGFLFYAHITKGSITLVPAFISSWITFVFSVLMIYYLSSANLCVIRIGNFTIGKLDATRAPNYRIALNVSTSVIAFFILIVSSLTTNLAGKFYDISPEVEISASYWRALNCKDGDGNNHSSHSSSKSSDICGNSNYRALVASIVLLCLCWVALFWMTLVFYNHDQNNDKKDQVENSKHQWRRISVLEIHHRKSFSGMWKWIDYMLTWNVTDDHAKFPIRVELTKNDAHELQEYLVKKLAYYQVVNEQSQQLQGQQPQQQEQQRQ